MVIQMSHFDMTTSEFDLYEMTGDVKRISYVMCPFIHFIIFYLQFVYLMANYERHGEN